MPQSPSNSPSSSFNIPVEKLFEQAEETGVLVLTGRKLSIFPPTVSSFDLTDVTVVDLSANRFVVLPQAIAEMVSVERLCCYNNVMRTLPPLNKLQSLISLNISRNHLTTLPAHTCTLPLKELNVSHNRLVSLPDELGQLQSLMDLDVSGNEIVALPACIGELSSLRDLNVRRNHLQSLPDELTKLSLVRLDISVNRVSRLPLSFIRITSLRTLMLHDNPMVLPPTNVCLRGRVHIMKFLQAEMEQTNGKDDISVRSSRAAARRENRMNMARRTTRDKDSRSIPSRSSTISLEAEMEHVAKQHGLDWSGARVRLSSANGTQTGSSGKSSSLSGMVASSTTVSAGGIIPKALTDLDATLADSDDMDSDDMDTTPVSSPRTSTPNSEEQMFFDSSPGAKSSPSTIGLSASADRSVTGEESGSRNEQQAVPPPDIAVSASPGESPPHAAKQLPSMAHLLATEPPPPPQRDLRHRSFTVTRLERRSLEQSTALDSLRGLLEGTLGYHLPADMMLGLADGVVLCNLLNKLRPKTIPVIYAPPRDGQLSQGKSFKNVDSFVNGCFKVGIEESMVCTAGDILHGQNPLHIYITVKALLTIFNMIEVAV